MKNNALFELFERTLMLKLLDGDNEILNQLRKQYETAKIKHREFSGVGFFTTFDISDSYKLDSNKSFQLGDVKGEVNNVKNGVGFILFIQEGKINMLEGYTYDEKWPEEITNYRLSYIAGEKRDLDKIRKKYE